MEKISLKLKKRVDLHCEDFRQNSKLFKQGWAGKITHYHAASYVINLEHLFYENCVDILAASSRYSEDKKLHEFFLEKYKEEKGHDAWARADWVAMSKKQVCKETPVVLPEMKEFTENLHNTMLTSPYRYITYMYVAEYMSPILGPIWLDILDKNLGIKSTQVTALSKHIDLDVYHAMEVAHALDHFELDETLHVDLITYVDELFVGYNKFFNALADINGTDYKTTSRITSELSAIS